MVVGARDSSADLSLALIIGLAALGLLLLLLLPLLFVVVRRRRRQQKPGDHEALATPTSSTLESGSDASGSSMTSGQTELQGHPAPVSMTDASTTRVNAHATHTSTAFASTSATASNFQPSDPAVHRPTTDPLPGLGPERPQPQGPTGRYVYVPPKVHREPRGWAPASHAVPAAVKRTWGRAMAKFAAERNDQPPVDMY